MSAQRKLRVVTKAKKNKVPFFLAVCKGILAGVTAHQAMFPSLPVLLSVLLSQIQSLDAAQQAVRTRVVGAAAVRDVARDALYTSVESIRAYVQVLCDGAPEQAVTLAQAAGMQIAAVGVRAKPVLAAARGVQSGAVLLDANASLLGSGRGTKCFNWEYTIDGRTWLAALSTPKAKTTITGLPPLTLCGFRVCVTDGNGQGPWSQTVSILVH